MSISGSHRRAGTVTVWWAHPLDPGTHPGLVSLLDAHERERMAALRQETDRARYLAAHALTRIVLGEHLATDPAGLRLDRTCRCGQQHGKPRLAERPDSPGFSLTHSGSLVGVALGPGPVGVDVEHGRALTSLDGLAEHVLSSAERGNGDLDAHTFLITWTRKEALLKATGDGLSSPMDAITLSGPREAPRVHGWGGERRGPMWLSDLDTPEPDHPAALAGFGAGAPAVTTCDGDAVLGR
ncbi:MAG: 4'-phosphopantetheinyl transferase superfamily protein [Pseudonocardia sp.]|nr:4'-phosphopantetheinyl transferase superfamily protein [Pseudonocardia sp.]